MPPVRRYLRITKYSVLECRIYLDDPADVHRWLLNPRDPVLPRVVEAVRPYVLPKLREENARAKSGKGGKRKGWKDVVAEDDFEVAIFLTETSSRHAILKKEKSAKSEKPRLGTRDGRLTGSGTKDVPLEVSGEEAVPLVREESQDDTPIPLAGIPVAGDGSVEDALRSPLQEGDHQLSLSDDSNEDETLARRRQRAGVIKEESVYLSPGDDDDDKKKMALNTTYDGFTIYGRILCLVVKRRGTARGRDLAGGAGQAMMEEWISSTQAGESQMMDD